MVRIALGAGHGMNTPGKRCLKSLDKNETREWVLNNRVANYVEEFLKEYEGYELMRVDDRTGKRDVPLAERTKKANDWKADIYISIHHNAGINGGSGGGIVVYRYPNSSKFTKAMQKRLYDELIKETNLKGNRANPLGEANFHVLRETKMAAVLIENGFMDSRTDVPIILSDAHARKSAKAIVNWLAKEYKLEKKPKPKPKPKPSKDGFYRVVVGSYREKENAERRVKELEKAGFESFIAYYDQD
ncbi:MAG: N-acetylmuramoyl-L-alanine amidase [Tissierellaceae bacterium]